MAKKINLPKDYNPRIFSDKLLDDGFNEPQMNFADQEKLEKKKTQLLRAKTRYQRLCGEFIDLWVQVNRKGKKL